jgi:hypothetical protein
MSAFEAFKAQARDGLMAANEGILLKEANARLKEMWDQMGEEEKGPYKNAAKEDKERFTKEMETYHPDADDVDHPVSGAQKTNVGGGGVQRCLFYYCLNRHVSFSGD